MDIFISLHEFEDVSLLILRLTLGVIFLSNAFESRNIWHTHSSEEDGESGFFLAKLLSFLGFLGGTLMILGFLTQLIAAFFGISKIIDAFRKRKNRFPTKFGWQFDLLLVAATVTIFFFGGGGFTLDRLIFSI